MKVSYLYDFNLYPAYCGKSIFIMLYSIPKDKLSFSSIIIWNIPCPDTKFIKTDIGMMLNYKQPLYNGINLAYIYMY